MSKKWTVISVNCFSDPPGFRSREMPARKRLKDWRRKLKGVVKKFFRVKIQSIYSRAGRTQEVK
jgi:hypothetical protein